MTTRGQIVEQARLWLGRNEKNGSHKEIIDIYNAHKPLARGYKVKYTDAWCATFVSAVAITCGATDLIPTECGCNQMIELFKAKGIWQEKDSYNPKPGDILFYDWDDSGLGDNTGRTEHVGIVRNVVNGVIYVIEGNYHNAVGIRDIAVNGKYIRGFGVPKYSEESIQKGEKKVMIELKVLRKGAKGAQVKTLQRLLKAFGYDMEGYGVDGSFGGATERAVKAYQKAKKLEIDGVVGKATWSSLLGA